MGSLVLTAAWYFATTQTLAQIPAVMAVVVDGVEEVTLEVVDGSKMVVRCVAIGAMIIAAIAIVQFGFWFLYSIRVLLRRCRPRVSDSHEERYGGRLLDSTSSQRGEAALRGLAAREA